MTETNSMRNCVRQNNSPKFGEVHNAFFPFEEDPTRGKDRPVIVLSDELVELPNGEFVEKSSLTDEQLEVVDIQKIYHTTTKVTSRHRVYDEYDVLIEKWDECGLAHPSTARCAKTIALPKQNFRSFRGYLDIMDLQNILDKIDNYLEDNN